MDTGEASIFQYQALFGSDPTPGMVAAELAADAEMEIFLRDPGDGELRRLRAPALPFLLVADEKLLAGWKGEAELTRLAGRATFGWLAQFAGWSALEAAVKHLQKKSGATPSSPEAPYVFISDPVQQFLLRSGRTHFRELRPEALRMLALDIETYCEEGFEFPQASRPTDRVIAISLADHAGWESVLSGREMDEREMLLALGETIRARDPDCLVGHNVYRYDLEYLEARAARCGVTLAWGRDGSALRGHPSRLTLAERTITYRKYEVYGRHIVDTWMLAQHYDIATRELAGFGLKEVARHLGLAREDRVYVAGSEISRTYRQDPERLAAYALDDVRETRDLAALLLPAFFVQAQIFPFSFQNVILRGTATRIDSLFLREYLHRSHSVPAPSPAAPVGGGFTGIRFQGIARHVLHCDVASLYPSLMLAEGIAPATDELGVFLELLRHLTGMRLKGKEAVRRSENPGERHYWEAFQSAMKILVNSFFGYLAFPLGRFNDFEQANRLTARGRELIQAAVRWLEGEGCLVIEIDTDGIYFCPPPQVQSQEEEEDLMERLAATFPRGLRLELDGRYRAMFSYKMKNYALLDDRDRLTLKGSGLTSRGIEGFLRDFMAEMFRLALAGRQSEIMELRQSYREAIVERRMPLDHLVKTETLHETLESYREKVRRKARATSAPYELALASGRPYQPGDQVSYYVAGSGKRVKVHEHARLAADCDPQRRDENVDYYVGKLDEMYDKFAPLLLGEGSPVTDAPREGGAGEEREEGEEGRLPL